MSAVRIDVDQGQTLVATRTVPIPSNTPAGGPAADAFFVLPPGAYSVTATALTAAGGASTVCMSATASVDVATGQTTEVTLALLCGGPGNGGLDVEVTAEHAPLITALTFEPNKFVTVCEPVAVTITASSPDGLPLTYTWSVASSPGGTESAAPAAGLVQLPPGVASLITASGNSAVIDAATAGDYSFTVTVTDTNDHSASLTFPVHMLAGDGCASVTREASASAERSLFGLQPASSIPAFTDIGPNDPLFATVQSIAPFLNRQLLCFGCALISKFLPDVPTTRAGNVVPLLTILVARNLVSLLSASDADAVLGTYADGASIATPARPFLATALSSGIMTPLPGNQIGAGVPETSADSEALLARVTQMFNLGGTP